LLSDEADAEEAGAGAGGAAVGAHPATAASTKSAAIPQHRLIATNQKLTLLQITTLGERRLFRDRGGGPASGGGRAPASGSDPPLLFRMKGRSPGE
jgi:hypothetical protein